MSDSSHARFLEDQVTCAICHEHFRDPRLLPCGHTYCKQCLDDLFRVSRIEGQITCPECREVVKLGPNGTEQLRVDFKMNQIMSHLTISSFEKEAKECDLPCENCASRDPSKGRCQNCCKFMCDFCLEAHRRILDTREHKIMTLGEFRETFGRHISKHEPKSLNVIGKGEQKKIEIETESNNNLKKLNEKISLLTINEQSSQNQKNTELAEEILMNDDQNFKVKSCNSSNKFTKDSNMVCVNILSTCNTSSLQISVNSTDLDGARHEGNIQNIIPDMQDQVHKQPVLQGQDDLHDHRDLHDQNGNKDQSGLCDPYDDDPDPPYDDPYDNDPEPAYDDDPYDNDPEPAYDDDPYDDYPEPAYDNDPYDDYPDPPYDDDPYDNDPEPAYDNDPYDDYPDPPYDDDPNDNDPEPAYDNDPYDDYPDPPYDDDPYENYPDPPYDDDPCDDYYQDI